MKIWSVDTDPGKFVTLQFKLQDDRKKYAWNYFDGESLAAGWEPPVLEHIGNGEPPDCPGNCGGAIFVSSRVVKFVRDMGLEHIEFLPLDYAGETYYIMNVLKVLDCIDGPNSRTEGDTAVDYQDISFLADRLGDEPLFKSFHHATKQVYNHRIFVSDGFKRKVEDRGFSGFQFTEVWDSAFNWQMKAQQLEALQRAVDQSLIESLDFKQAIQKVEQEKLTVYSGKYALKLDERNELILGTIQLDGSYEWANVFYVPLDLLGLKWGIRRERKSFLNRLFGRIVART